MKNIFIIIIVVGFIITCTPKKEQIIKPPKPKNIYEAIRIQAYKEIDSLDIRLGVPLYVIRHQKKIGKDFIEIYADEYYNKDSVSGYEIYKNKLLIYYSKDYFQKYFPDFKLEDLIKKYGDMAYKENTISLYDITYDIFEIVSNDSIKKLSIYTPHYSELFNYGDRYIELNKNLH